MPNYRVPLLPETHENEVCHSKACLASVGNAQNMKAPKKYKVLCICPKHIASIRTVQVLSKLAQRAQREATGYY
eukprot:4660751-Heterocapsa_arctica.AAC.1